VARFIRYLYHGRDSLSAHKLGDGCERYFLHAGSNHAGESPLPPDLLKESQPLEDKYSELIPARVSLYAFGDKYQVPALQKLMLNELFEWKSEDQCTLKRWFWDIVSQLKDACPGSNRWKVKADECLCTMTGKERAFVDDNRFWDWVHERKLAETTFRPFLSDPENFAKSSAKKRKVVELD
jgi:hypothetical protein